MEVYRRLETPLLWAVIMEETIGDDGVLSDGDLADPTTSTQVIIEDSTGTVVQAATDMTKSSTGKYYYQGYTIPSTANTGEWHYEVRANDSGAVATAHGSFIVKEQVA